MEEDNERQLFEAIRKGNKEAFNALVQPQIARAYQTSLTILRSPHLAEEAVQNALIESYTSIMASKDIRNFRGWFNWTIANRAIDLVRRENRHNKGLDIDELVVADMHASPMEEVLRKEQSNQLLEAVMSLELNQRVVVVLYYFQELKVDEIASVLKTKEGTIKSRLYHARLKLNQLVTSLPQFEAKAVQA